MVLLEDYVVDHYIVVVINEGEDNQAIQEAATYTAGAHFAYSIDNKSELP